MKEQLTIEFDGGSRGNPGPAAIGVVIRAEDGTAIFTLGRPIGRATNNVAEYRALITGLEEAKKLGASRALVRGDSELVIKQLRGEYRVKHPDMKTLYDQAQKLIREFDDVKIEHNLRHKNELADKLVNRALDHKREVTDVDGDSQSPTYLDSPTPISTKAGDRFACVRCGSEIEVRKPSPLHPHQLKPYTCQCGANMRELERDR